MLRPPLLHNLRSDRPHLPPLTFNPATTPGMGDMTSPLCSRGPPPAIEGGVLIRNKMVTLLPHKVGFGGNHPYKRRLSGTNLYLHLPPLLRGVKE